MTVVELTKEGARLTVLGNDILNEDTLSQQVQYVVKANTWFGAFPNEGSSYSFVGCTVAPGFKFRDFEIGSRAALLSEFPHDHEIIIKLTEGLP
mmetsp:Transcript_6155/g.7963  ORF Transcript_6155/g.7963 Transcript_6155/m.7963 type:complete len:94 (+) Transcript_6155:302-583(+)